MLFLLKNNLFLYIILVGIFGVVYTWNHPKSYWKSFPYFLITVGILDSLGGMAYDYSENFANYYYLAFLIPLQVLYYLWILNKNLKTGKRFFYFGSTVFIIAIIAEIVAQIGLPEFHFASLSFTVGNLILLANILRYFYQLSSSNQILTFYWEKTFWVSLGLLIFWLGSLPFYGIFNYLFKNHRTIFTHYFPLVLTFNYIMYTCFLISFIWGKKN